MAREDQNQQPEDELLDEEQLEGEEDDGEPQNRGWLGWVVSGTIHASLLAIFAAIVFKQVVEQEAPPQTFTVQATPPVVEKPKEKKLETKERTLEALKEADKPNPDPSVEVNSEVTTTEDEVVKDTAKGREEAIADSEQGGVGTFPAIGAAGGAKGQFGSRNGGGRARRTARGGGNAGSEGAVDAGLIWLKRHQDKATGAWDPVSYPANCELDPKCEPGERAAGNVEVAMTGYALLCFLGRGHDHKSVNTYKATVKKGIEWLLSQQGADGRFNKARNYEHPIAAMALFEAYGMTQDADLREPCEKALKVILDCQAQDPNATDKAYGGLGWDYSAPNADRNDSSVSGWNAMALKSAKMAGLDADKGLAGVKTWLNRTWKAANKDKLPTDPYGDSWFPYTWSATTDKVDGDRGSNQHKDLTCVGMVCAVFMGHEPGEIMLETMANHVMKFQKPTSAATYNSYYTYYNTLGMFQVQGPKWTEWNTAVRDFIVGAQRKDEGCFYGSWNPKDGVQWHGAEVGRVLSTCYAILNLQVYYRYDLLHKKK